MGGFVSEPICAEPINPLKRLALMRYDFRPHEDEAIAAIFIVLMIVVTVLIFALA